MAGLIVTLPLHTSQLTPCRPSIRVQLRIVFIGHHRHRLSCRGTVHSSHELALFPQLVWQVYWSWSDNAWLADGAKDTLGYRDFAGSGVVHLTGILVI